MHAVNHGTQALIVKFDITGRPMIDCVMVTPESIEVNELREWISQAQQIAARSWSLSERMMLNPSSRKAA